MNLFKISIKYAEKADLQAKINSSMALRRFLNFLQQNKKIHLKNISDTSCEFIIENDGEEITSEFISKTLDEFISSKSFDITVTECDSDPDIPASEESESGFKIVDKSDLSTAKKNRLDDIIKRIDELIGAEDFKKKAREIISIAPKFKDVDRYIYKFRFLFSIDDGNGITTITRLFGELLNALELTPSANVYELPPLENSDDQSLMTKFKYEYGKMLNEAQSPGMFVLDLSKCYDKLNREMYREILGFLFSRENIVPVIFRIPYLEQNVRLKVEEALADQFFLHSVPFVPMSMEDLYKYSEKVVKTYGYSFDDTMPNVLNTLIAKEKSDGKFYGFKTIEKIVASVVYEKATKDLTDNSLITSNDINLSDDILDGMGELSGEEQLKSLCGLDDVIKQIQDIVAFIEYSKNDPKNSASFHMRFVGNPGTGKTVVARILGKILKEKGILRTGVFFEYSGNDFIAQYVGHTAPKVAQMCRDAYGGILFIDEAYALSPAQGGNPVSGGSFHQEALNTLLTEMENHRTDMVVIMAGYEDEIDELMQHNPGLTQRIPYTIKFENYSKKTLADIFFSMAGRKFHYDNELEATVKKYFDELPNNIYYSPNFANARYVRNLYERTVNKAVLRASLEKVKVATLTAADFLKAAEEIKSTATAASGFGKDKSGARMFNEERAKIKFKDVRGQEEAKQLLAEMVDFLKNPSKYEKIGARIPKGALLYGPPGTGKTMLAKAVAGESGVPFLSIAGSDLISQYVGKGAEQVTALFEKARKLAPSIIFIDEIDSIGMSRSLGNNSSALLQLLTEMDGFDESSTVIVLAATNRPESLDPALRRPGRFDREVPVELPDLAGRIEILKLYLETVEHEDDINYREIGNLTTGFSGADLRNIVNEAAHRAIRENRDKITTEDLQESVEVVAVGYVKKNKILSDKEKWIVCYHEIGHALMSALQTHTAPVKKITVVPRTSGALGYVMHADEEEKSLSTKTEMENRIAVCVAGRAAEEIHFGEITTGASNDIQKATAIARAIVATYGMTDEFGMVCFESNSGGYLGGQKSTNCSEATAEAIDKKVIEIVGAQYKKVLEALKANEALLDDLSSYIHEKESITGDEFMEIFNKRKNG